MFQGLKNGQDVINASIKVFFKFPILLLPLLFVWLIYAPTVIYFKWHFDWSIYTTELSLLIVFLIIFGFALLLTLSCSILLEIIQHIETGKKINLFRSLWETLTKNLLQIILLSFIWALFWFILTILEAIFSEKDKSNDDETPENIAETLSDSKKSSNLSTTFDLLKKGIRMTIFLIMPAVAWEGMGFGKSLKRGLNILKRRFSEFMAGFTLSYLAAVIVFTPPGIMFYLHNKFHIEFPDWSWFLCVIYIAFAWSYTIFIEQMFAAELYLWQLKWEKEVFEAKSKGKRKRPPRFNEVQRPSIIDDIPELLKNEK